MYRSAKRHSRSSARPPLLDDPSKLTNRTPTPERTAEMFGEHPVLASAVILLLRDRLAAYPEPAEKAHMQRALDLLTEDAERSERLAEALAPFVGATK